MPARNYTFGGRIRKKEKKDPQDWVKLPLKRMAFIYQRLSTTEQKKNSLYSIERQDALYDLAKKDGYKASLSPEQIEAIKKSKDYKGYFVDGQIFVEQRDLGVSGTLDKEHRIGLANMIDMIEKDMVESVYVVEISRISRDQTLISGLAFGELCKAHNVIIVTPVMRLNLNNDMHMRIYRYEIDRAAEELKSLKFRLHGARDMKARHGYYAGGSIPPGYILDTDEFIDGKRNPNYQKYKIYEPHAKVVRLIFDQLKLPGTSPKTVAIYCKQNGIVFPPFPDDIANIPANVQSFAKSRKNPDGSYPISMKRISSIAQNPAYIGWWIWGGEVISKNNHPAIVDEETFWAVQEKFTTRARPIRGEPLLLAGLLFCVKHEPPRRMICCRTKDQKCYYRCRDRNYEETCVMLTARILDEPISELVLSKCRFPQYADRVLKQLKQEYEQAKAEAMRYRREYQRLTREIENLKQNLARTRTPDQVDMILEMIEEKMRKREELSKVENQPIGRVISAADVRTVEQFLSNLSKKWPKIPDRFKNELLTILLRCIYIDHDAESVHAWVVWRTGLMQELIIYRPFIDTRRRWTKEEEEILYKHYQDASVKELLQLLPGREWSGIRKHANLLGLKRSEEAKIRELLTDVNKNNYYSEEEDQVIHDFFAFRITESELYERLSHRSWDSINMRARKLGYSFRQRKSKIQWKLVSETMLTQEEVLEMVTQGNRCPWAGAILLMCACRTQEAHQEKAPHGGQAISLLAWAISPLPLAPPGLWCDEERGTGDA